MYRNHTNSTSVSRLNSSARLFQSFDPMLKCATNMFERNEKSSKPHSQSLACKTSMSTLFIALLNHRCSTTETESKWNKSSMWTCAKCMHLEFSAHYQECWVPIHLENSLYTHRFVHADANIRQCQIHIAKNTNCQIYRRG